MKKVKSILIVSFILVLSFSFAAFANGDDPYRWFAYSQSNGSFFVDDFDSFGENNYNMVPVRFDEETGRPIYQWDDRIGTLTGVNVFRAKDIGDYAFYEAGEKSRLYEGPDKSSYGLYNVGIGESVKCIGKSAFENAQNRFRVNTSSYTPFGGTVIDTQFAFEEIKDRAFYNTGIQSIELPETLKVIGESVFQYTPYLDYITIPGSLEKISKNAFANSGLRRVEILEGVKTIDEKAFADCPKLSTVDIAESVEYVADNAFDNCLDAKLVVLSKTNVVIKNISEGPVVYCYSGSAQEAYCKENAIAYKLLSDPVKCGENAYISYDEETSTLIISGEGAMWNEEECSTFFNEPGFSYFRNELKNVKIDDGITSANFYLLYNALSTDVDDLYIGKDIGVDGIKEISEQFLYLLFFKNYSVSDENPYLKSVDGVVFSKDSKIMYMFPKNSNKTEYVLPDGVEEIADFAFTYAFNLESVTFPEGLKRIGDSVFVYSAAIRKVDMPSSLKYIGKSAFETCVNLDIKLPEDATDLVIDDGAFSMNKPQVIVIPEGVTYIGEYNFGAFASHHRNVINKSKTCVYPDAEFYYEERILDVLDEFYYHFYDYLFSNGNYAKMVLGLSTYEDMLINAYLEAKDYTIEKYGEEYLFMFNDEKHDVDEDQLSPYELPEEKIKNTYLNVTCLEDSAQHQYCIDNGITHSILSSTCDDTCNVHNIYTNDYIEPTCVDNGYEGGVICLDCEKIFEAAIVIPAKGHTPVTQKGVAPTCTQSGYADYKACDDCGELLEELVIIPSKGHSDSDSNGICDDCGSKIEGYEPEEEGTFVERIVNFFKGIIDSIIQIFKRLFG